MNEKPDSLAASDNPGVRLPPPFIFLGLLLVGLWFDSPWFEGRLAAIWVTVVGALIAASGVAMLVSSVPRHKKAGTNIEPWRPTTTIITTGVYGYSRNPIYLGLALVHGGLAVCAGSVAALVTLIAAVVVMRIYVIAREERYLEAKFGQVYIDYKQRVRRWI